MDESGSTLVLPVRGGLGKQMRNENDLSWPEIVTNPEHDESKNEEVIQDEMASHIGRRCDEDIVAGEKVPDVADLGKKEQDPVDSGNEDILREWSLKSSSLAPDRMSMWNIAWFVNGVVDASHDD